MSESLVPRGPRARRALATLLASSGTMLVGRIDHRGVVVAANRALGRWIAGGPEPRLGAALRPSSRERWERALAAPGRCRVVTLWFGASRAERAGFRCRLIAEEGGTVWLWGEPAPDRPRPTSRTTPEPDVGAESETDLAARTLRGELERARRRARRLARTDPLTGLANRRRGLRRLAVEARRAHRRGTPLACLMADLDRFKAINDTFGHPVGDRVLRAAARALAVGLRGSDLVARYGGEEFLMILPGTTAAVAGAIADRLRARLADCRIAPLEAPLGASFGAAALGPGESAGSLLARADAALIQAKRDGRGRVVTAPPLAATVPPARPGGVPETPR